MKKENPFVNVIIVTRDMTPDKEAKLESLKESAEYPYLKISMVVNPEGIGLTQIYGDIMADKAHDNTDIFIFMHDDIDFLKKGWVKEVVNLFLKHEDYGIIGVAGSAQFDEGGAWWNYKKKYGQVLHRKDGKSWLSAFSPLLKDDLEEVAVIDGLFMAVAKDRVTKPFDKEIMGFDFYDIDFCLANHLDGKTKIGVTTNIRIAHNSVGELKPNWHVNKAKVIEKYKQNFPIDLPKKS